MVIRTYDRYSRAKKRSRDLLDAVMDNGGTYDTKSRHYYVSLDVSPAEGTRHKYVSSISQSEYKYGDFSHPREHGYVIERHRDA